MELHAKTVTYNKKSYAVEKIPSLEKCSFLNFNNEEMKSRIMIQTKYDDKYFVRILEGEIYNILLTGYVNNDENKLFTWQMPKPWDVRIISSDDRKNMLATFYFKENIEEILSAIEVHE